MVKIFFQLVSPERTLVAEEVDSLSCPTSQGQITVLPHHIPLVANLVPGEIIARTGSDHKFIHVAGGFVEIKPNSQVVILADAAEHFHELDEARAEAAKQQALEVLKASHVSDQAYAQAAASLERNLSRIKIARKHAHRKTTVNQSENTL